MFYRQKQAINQDSKQKRLKSTYLEAKLEKIKPEIENKYVSLEKGIKENFLKIMSENLDQDLPFTLLFWDQ